MSARDKPLHLETVKFCRHHLGKHCFAAFTGQDYPAWNAFVYLLQCFAHGGGEGAIAAMRSAVRCAQSTEDVMRVFVQAIPAVLCWGDVARLWPQIVHEVPAYDTGTPLRLLFAIERNEVYVKNTNRTEERIWKHGLGAPATHFDVAAGGSR